MWVRQNFKNCMNHNAQIRCNDGEQNEDREWNGTAGRDN